MNDVQASDSEKGWTVVARRCIVRPIQTNKTGQQLLITHECGALYVHPSLMQPHTPLYRLSAEGRPMYRTLTVPFLTINCMQLTAAGRH